LQKRKREIEWPYFCTAVIGAFNTTSEINQRRPKLQLNIRNTICTGLYINYIPSLTCRSQYVIKNRRPLPGWCRKFIY